MHKSFAHFLFILAAWTLVIKYLFPAGFALAQGEPIGAYIFWDFWWVIHIWLGWALLTQPRYLYGLALVVSVVEIIIIVTIIIIRTAGRGMCTMVTATMAMSIMRTTS